MQVALIEMHGRGEACADNRYTSFAQAFEAAPFHSRVWVYERTDDTLDARLDQRLGTGSCAAMRAARLQAHIGASTLRLLAGFMQCDDFCVWAARAHVRAAADNVTIFHKQASDPWIRAGGIQALACDIDSRRQIGFINF